MTLGFDHTSVDLKKERIAAFSKRSDFHAKEIRNQTLCLTPHIMLKEEVKNVAFVGYIPTL